MDLESEKVPPIYSDSRGSVKDMQGRGMPDRQADRRREIADPSQDHWRKEISRAGVCFERAVWGQKWKLALLAPSSKELDLFTSAV